MVPLHGIILGCLLVVLNIIQETLISYVIKYQRPFPNRNLILTTNCAYMKKKTKKIVWLTF